MEAAEVAVTVTFAGDGTVAGAAYLPALVIVPQAEPVHPVPESFQVTVVLVVPETDAVNCCVSPVTTVAVEGESLTEMLGGVPTVTVALAVEPSVMEVAVTVTVGGEGIAAGAV